MNTPKDSTAERTHGSLHPAGSSKSRYWRVTRKPENQRQFPGEYSSNHILMVESTHEEALEWATGYFPNDQIVNVERLTENKITKMSESEKRKLGEDVVELMRFFNLSSAP